MDREVTFGSNNGGKEGRALKLAALTDKIPVLQKSGDMQIEITGISQDSRKVNRGDIFLCIKGAKFDGHRYLKQAAEAGAVAAVVEEMPAEDCGLALIRVADVNSVMKDIAGLFYGYPDRKLKLIGVVGTNGKTTSTYLIRNILEAAGYRVGLIGTIANIIGERKLPVNNTTPGVLELQRLFAEMVEADIEYVVMEVSSHSIDQGRVAGLTFINGLFTNITQDHLDYHGTFEEYLRVKTQFFVDLPVTSWAAVNTDDPHAEHIIERTTAKVIRYGIENQAEVKAEDIRIDPSGVSYQAVTPLGTVGLKLSLTGYFNVYNSLGALATMMTLGIDLETIKRGLETISGVPGRFQRVPESRNFGVIIDYAHTPDGLENILKTGRKLTPKRLLLVFGCGGDRDRTKRPIMGGIAARMADYTVITSDNPRSENPMEIIKEIEAGLNEANPNASYEIEPDRALAIHKIIRRAQAADLVLIAGKGHETYQIFADRTIHFDDAEIARAALDELLTNI